MAQSKVKKFARRHQTGIRRAETAAATVAGGVVGMHAGAIGGAYAGGRIATARHGQGNMVGTKGVVQGLVHGTYGGGLAGAAGGYALARHFHNSHQHHSNTRRAAKQSW